MSSERKPYYGECEIVATFADGTLASLRSPKDAWTMIEATLVARQIGIIREERPSEPFGAATYGDVNSVLIQPLSVDPVGCKCESCTTGNSRPAADEADWLRAIRRGVAREPA